MMRSLPGATGRPTTAILVPALLLALAMSRSIMQAHAVQLNVTAIAAEMSQFEDETCMSIVQLEDAVTLGAWKTVSGRTGL